MNLDALQGRGAFRCGCGIRVAIQEPERDLLNCVACRTVALKLDPFPLCLDHYESSGLAEYHHWLAIGPENAFAEIIELPETKQRMQDMAARTDVFNELNSPAPQSVVYFLRVGDLIKIGTTTNLRQRLASFSVPTIEVLATISGSRQREVLLHRKFAAYRQRGEWFDAAPELLEYIQSL